MTMHLSGMKIKIGVMGSAQGPLLENGQSRALAQQVGRIIAQRDCILVNGACPGLPHDAAVAAKAEGGFVLGISPAFSEPEHIHRYKSPPTDCYDIVLFTGEGLMKRDIVNIRSSDAIIILGGGIGTLNEFTVAFDEGRYVGFLEGTGGVADSLDEILRITNRPRTDRIISMSDPEKLVDTLLKHVIHGERMLIEDQRIVGSPYESWLPTSDEIDPNARPGGRAMP